MAITAADLVVKMSADTKNAEAGMQRMSRGISGFAKSAAQVGVGILGAAAFTPIIRGFAGAATGALDFGKQMANVNSIAQLSPGAFQALNDQVLALTSDPRIAQAPATLASGLYDIYSSGFQGAEGLTVLKQAALAATAGVTDTATSARAITAVLNAYGEGADDAAHVSDVLFQTVNDGVITFETLANNMGNTLPMANALGVSVEQLGAAYAQMTLKGVSGAQAETQIASLMKSAANPTDALTQSMLAHGKASAQDAIASEGLAGFLAMVMDSADGNQQAMYDMLGTQEAVNAATILGADGAKAYTKEIDKMKHASDGAGATNKALAKQMQSSSFQIAKMKQQVLTLATIGFGILAPVIGRVAGVMTKFLSRTLIPFTSIIGRATRANFTFGKGFDKLLAGIPQPLRRSVHAIASLTDSLSDMWRRGFSRNEMTQAFHAFQAIGEELGQAVHFVVNAVVDIAVSLGTLLINGIKAAPGAIFDWIKGKLFGGGPAGDLTGGPAPVVKAIDAGVWDVAVALGKLIMRGVQNLRDWVEGKIMGMLAGGGGATSQDPASPMAAQAGMEIPLGTWILSVGAPQLGGWLVNMRGRLQDFIWANLLGGSVSQDPASPMSGRPGDLTVPILNWLLQVGIPTVAWDFGNGIVWFREQVYTQLRGDNNEPTVPVDAWQVKPNEPTINWSNIAGGVRQWLHDKISTEFLGFNVDIDDWSFTITNPPENLTLVDIGVWIKDEILASWDHMVDIDSWSIELLNIPGINYLGAALEESSVADWIYDAITSAWDGLVDLANWDWSLNIGMPDITLDFGLSELADAVKEKVKALGGIGFDLPNPFNINVPNPFGGGGGASGSGGVLQGQGTGHEQAGPYAGYPISGIPQAAPPPIPLKFVGDNQSITDTITGATKTATDHFADHPFKATFDADTGPMAQAYTKVFGWGDTFDRQDFKATLSADNGPMSVAYTDAFGWGKTFDAQNFQATLSADNGPAAIAYTNVFSWGNTWAAQTFTARFAIDTSGLWNALAVAQTVAAGIAAVMPHSPAKKGPLSKPISFGFIADAARRDLSGLGSSIEGYLGMRGNRRPLAYAGAHAGPRNITVNVHGSSDAGATGRAVVKELRAAGF